MGDQKQLKLVLNNRGVWKSSKSVDL